MYFWLTSSDYPKTREFLTQIGTCIRASVRDFLFNPDTTRILEALQCMQEDIARLHIQVEELKAEVATIEPSFMKVKLF
jgi:uncharacterized protein YPO0396